MTSNPLLQLSVTAGQEATSLWVINPGEVRQGDILLVTQIPGEAVGKLMERLDGTVFSHSGIATRADGAEGAATHLASALAQKLPHSLDYGGVRWDLFEKYWENERDLYCIPMPDDARREALEHLADFEPVPDGEGSFSYVKLVTVAAGLRAVELEDTQPELAQRMFDAACTLADAWRATSRVRSYFCAELVANAFGRTFTRAEMVPPEVDEEPDKDIAEWRWVGFLVDLMVDWVDADDPRRQAWMDLCAILTGEDWDFVADAATALAKSGMRVFGSGPREAAVPGPLRPPSPTTGQARPDTPIPHALVTPRMLWQVFGHDEDGRSTLRRVRRPSESTTAE
jgi:hypothetical protein